MCEFISWKEVGDEILFLTWNDIYNTPRGKELQAYTVSSDFVGHGAIAFYYEIPPEKGINRECTDFSSPSNFPKVIVDAIKAGKMAGLGIAKQLLTPEALAEYEKIRQPAWEEYEKIVQPAQAEYLKIRQPAWEEYEKIQQPAWEEYEKIRQSTFWNLFSKPENRPLVWR
jgi:hypothetical protein